MTSAIINGKLLPLSEAAISIQDRGFRYGDGVFETIAVHKGVPYQYDWHINRLSNGLKAIHIAFETEILQPLCRNLLHHNTISNGSLRIQVTRGVGSKGYLPSPVNDAAAPSFVIETLSDQTPLAHPVKLQVSSYQKISDKALPTGVKLCQGLNSILARMEAAQRGYFDALMLNENNQVCETSSANIFWMVDDQLYTPALECGLVEGSTRAALMRLCKAKETIISADALKTASHVMITNSNWGILPVSEIETIGQWNAFDPIFQLQQRLLKDRESNSHRHAPKWMPL